MNYSLRKVKFGVIRVSNEITPCVSDDGGHAENSAEPPKVEHKKHKDHSSSSSSSSKKKHDEKKHRDRDRDHHSSSHSSSSSSKKQLEFPQEKLKQISKDYRRARRKMGDEPERNNNWFIG